MVYQLRPLPPSTKPLIVGYVPSGAKMDMIGKGKFKELPGYWLYNLQFECKGKLGRFCGWLFGVVYANKPVRIK